MVSRTQVPDGWRLARLGDVAKVVTGNTPSRETSAYYGGRVPWVKPADLASRRLVDSSAEYLTEAGVAVARQVPENCVLVSCIGTIGEVAISSVPLCFNQQINALIPSNSIWPSFLYWACDRQASRLLAISAKTAVPILNKSEFSGVSILLPPLLEQRTIAAVLDAIDEAIERTDAVIAATERLRNALLHELLTRGVPGWHSEWKEAPGLGTIPADWDVVRLGDVAEVNARSWDPSENNNILYLDLTSVVAPGVLGPPRGLAATDVPSRARRRVQTGDILVSTVRPNLRGFARVVTAPKNLIASTGFAVVTPKPIVSNSILYHHVMTDQFASYLEGCTTGQAYPAVRPIDVANFKLAVAPLPEQQAIAAALDSVDEAIEQARWERDGLRSLKTSAADALLTGRVRVGGV